MSPRFARAGRIPKPRLVLVSVFVAASSLAALVASYGSAAPAKAGPGFWLASSSGVVKAFGGAGQFGSLKTPGSGRVVGIAPTPDAGGYWLATAKGQVFGFGDAKVYGSMATRHLAKPIVGITGAPDGRGYWLFGGDGGVFSFGDARYLGSAGRAQLGSAVVAMAVAPGAKGYWLATRAGAVLRFGAVPLGPAKAAAPLGSAVAAMAATPDAKGYWLVTTKGKVVPFGDAHSYGSMTGALKASIVGIAPTANGKGYWLAARDGAVFAFGDAHQAAAGRQAAPQAQGPVSAIALSFNAGHLRAKTAPATSTNPATVAENCTKPVWSTSGAQGTEPVDPSGGEYWWMDNDAWSGSAGPQSLYVCNQSSWYAVSDQTNQQGQVETYPNSEYDVGGRAHGVATKPISAYHSITSSFSEDFPSRRLVGRRLRPVVEQLGHRDHDLEPVDGDPVVLALAEVQYRNPRWGGVLVSKPGWRVHFLPPENGPVRVGGHPGCVELARVTRHGEVERGADTVGVRRRNLLDQWLRDLPVERPDVQLELSPLAAKRPPPIRD